MDFICSLREGQPSFIFVFDGYTKAFSKIFEFEISMDLRLGKWCLEQNYHYIGTAYYGWYN